MESNIKSNFDSKEKLITLFHNLISLSTGFGAGINLLRDMISDNEDNCSDVLIKLEGRLVKMEKEFHQLKELLGDCPK
ncbi:MAG: hypothetical protein HQK49_09075 [Oligoflexia bacterium]|nr:hypothetical protein [Oligoflexia bacterium]